MSNEIKPLNDTYTSTGAKFFAHQEAMKNLRAGKGQCITTHVMLTDRCNMSCAFCSVQARAGDSLVYDDVLAYLDILLRFGLKSVILSGGGNPILYKCKKTGKDFNAVVDAIHSRGLEIGLITNGMPLKEYTVEIDAEVNAFDVRKSWKTVHPETLDKLTWIRISMAGLDHDEREVYVPDVDPSKTTLGFSYVGHDVFTEPKDPYHGKVSTVADLITIGDERAKLPPVWKFDDRIESLTSEIAKYVKEYKPKYVRLLPNCLESHMIADRCEKMQRMADAIDPEVVFVQYKPPQAPKACFLGYIHPVLNTCGGIFPCDSCVLNAEAGHRFANPWRVCHWSEVAQLYEKPVRSLIDDPATRCPGCVFERTNEILLGVVEGTIDMTPPAIEPTHKNFV